MISLLLILTSCSKTNDISQYILDNKDELKFIEEAKNILNEEEHSIDIYNNIITIKCKNNSDNFI